jgi:excisionase family DNA binding protein
VGGGAKAAKTDLRVVRCAERAGKLKAETLKGESEAGARFLTRRELAGVLKVSVRTVDEMVAAKEITPVRPHGPLVRFYLPHVIRELTAAAAARMQKLKGDTDFTDCHEKAQKTQREQPRMNTDEHGCGPLKTRSTRKT